MKKTTFKSLLKLQNSLSIELPVYLSKKFGFEIRTVELNRFICLEEYQSDCDGDDNHYIVEAQIEIDKKDLDKIIAKKLKWRYDIHKIVVDTTSLGDKLKITLECSIYLDSKY